METCTTILVVIGFIPGFSTRELPRRLNRDFNSEAGALARRY